MAIVWFDGFERFSGTTMLSQYYSQATATGSIGIVSGRYDGQGLQLGSNYITQPGSTGLIRTLTSTITSISTGVAINLTASVKGNNNPVLTLMNGSTTIAYVGFSDTNLVVGNNGGTVSVNLPKVFNPYQWNYIEIEAITSLTSGTLNFYWNGELLYALSGSPVKSSTNIIAIDSVRLSPPYGSGLNPVLQYDDFYITNTSTRLGELHIAGLKPTADTAQKQWTPSTGTTNFNMVNDLLKSTDTTYVQTLNAGDKDYYDIQDISASTSITGSVLAVGVYGAGNKSTFGPASAQLAVKSNTTESFGTSQTLYENINVPLPTMILETDPATSTAWTTNGVNNLQIGVRSS